VDVSSGVILSNGYGEFIIRFNKYTKFWKIVGNVLPFDECKDAWKVGESS
jgi:hypothetical protein